MEASFSSILCWSQKKRVLRLSSATFLRDFRDIPERGAVNRGCLRFLAGNKNAGFWREKKCQNSQNFSAKMPEKILHFSHFFALIGNTGGKRIQHMTTFWYTMAKRLGNTVLEAVFPLSRFF